MRLEYANLTHGLIGAWCPSLGATGYTLIDRAGRNNHGTLTNMGGQNNWRASGSGVALSLDGTDDYVAMPTTLDTSYINQSHTFSVWVNHPAVTQNFPAVLKHCNPNNLPFGTQFLLHSPSSATPGRMSASHGNGSAFAEVIDAAARNNTWYNACAVVDKAAQTIGLYINGALQASASISGVGIISLTSGVEIGRRVDSSNGVSAYAGQFDDARIYRRALTLSEIRLLASRRGIGLVPQRQRRANVLGSRFSVNVAGTWRDAVPWVNVGGTWKTAVPGTRVGGAWK